MYFLFVFLQFFFPFFLWISSLKHTFYQKRWEKKNKKRSTFVSFCLLFEGDLFVLCPSEYFLEVGEKKIDMATKKATGSAVPGIPAKIPAIAHPLAEDPADIASNINYHVQYSPHFSPFKFEPEQAYYATADSVRDRLIQVRHV